MIRQVPAHIFPRNGRHANTEGRIKIDKVFDGWPAGHSQFFFWDCHLPAGADSVLWVEGNRQLVVLPVYGELIISDSEQQLSVNVKPGELFTLPALEHKDFIVSNSAADHPCNFIWIALPAPPSIFLKYQVVSLKGIRPNQLKTLAGNAWFSVSAAVLDERMEVGYALAGTNTAYVYVLEGVFECQNRLLENRDGLAVWDTDTVEIESLGHRSVVLLVDAKL
ncbi:MAG: hypothetical protein QM664_11705 [Flavihumibacter sp.]